MSEQSKQELEVGAEIALKLVINPSSVNDTERSFLVRHGDLLAAVLRQAALQTESCQRQSAQKTAAACAA